MQQEIKPEKIEILDIRPKRVKNASKASSILHTKLTTIHQAWDLGLAAKFYLKSFNIYCILFYILLIALFATQVDLKIAFDEGADSLRVKKEVLKDAQLRDYSLISIYRVFRILWDAAVGSFDSVNQPLFPVSAAAYALFVKNSLVALVKTNQNLLLNSALVDESLRTVFLQKDVRIFYNSENEAQYFQNLTGFQAVDQIVSDSLNVLPEATKNITRAEKSLQIVFRNAMNDLLIKTEAATALFLQSIELQVNQGRILIVATCIIKVVLFIFTLIVLLFFIYRSYSQERLNMIALTKLDLTQIKEIQTRLSEFTKAILEANFEEDRNLLESFPKENVFSSGKKLQNNRHSQSLNTNGILRKYLFFAFKALVLFSVFIAIPIASSLLAATSIRFLYKQQSKLYFVNSMAKVINMGYATYRDLYSTNDTSEIRNEPISKQFADAISDISILRNKFLQTFLNEESLSDPVYSKILLGHSCKWLVSSTATDFCSYLEQRGVKLNLVTLLSDFEQIITEKQELFYASNRTREALTEIQQEKYEVFTTTLRVVLDESAMVANRTNIIFETKFVEVKAQAETTLVVCSIALALMAYIIWTIVFKGLREDCNQFKNVLRNFPPHLVLSNFLLKNFLSRTSNHNFDLTKNMDF